MKKTHTILAPDMLPVHFTLLTQVFRQQGYKFEILTHKGPEVIAAGLRYVHNDTCYPALLVIGQLISALETGLYDPNEVALMITQTGGGCRATSYFSLLRRALEKAGLAHVPVISLNISGLEKSPGFKFTLPMMRKSLAVLAYGDLLVLLANQVRPYEAVTGSTDLLLNQWCNSISAEFSKGHGYTMREIARRSKRIAEDFASLKVNENKCVKVGIVGEIYVKYAALGNNDLESFLSGQGCEVHIPGALGFGMYSISSTMTDRELYGHPLINFLLMRILFNHLLKLEKVLHNSVASTRLLPAGSFDEVSALGKKAIGKGVKMGEGWLLTAEMLELCDRGFNNIVITQPFGCLPNHICGRGMMQRIRQLRPAANIVAIDYDPGAARVNQENRIKLMLSSAR